MIIDHRPLGWGTVDVDGYLRGVASLHEQSPDAVMRGIEVVHAGPGGLASRIRLTGTSADGGDFEVDVHVVIIERGGRIARMELFPVDDPEAAARCVDGGRTPSIHGRAPGQTSDPPRSR